MELFLQPKKVTVRRAAWFLAVCLACFRPGAGQQAPPFYYDLDKEIKIEGLIKEIRIEPRPEGASPFLIILIQEKSDSRTYDVEIGPSGFFDLNFKKGDRVKVVGSQCNCNMETKCCNVIAREIQYRGDTVAVRDKHGFPVWRKGSPPMTPRRQGKDGC